MIFFSRAFEQNPRWVHTLFADNSGHWVQRWKRLAWVNFITIFVKINIFIILIFTITIIMIILVTMIMINDDRHLSCLQVILTGCSAHRGGITIRIPGNHHHYHCLHYNENDGDDDEDNGDEDDDGFNEDDDEDDDDDDKDDLTDDFPALRLREHQQEN